MAVTNTQGKWTKAQEWLARSSMLPKHIVQLKTQAVNGH